MHGAGREESAGSWVQAGSSSMGCSGLMQACTLVLMRGLFNLVCIHKWALGWAGVYTDVVW